MSNFRYGKQLRELQELENVTFENIREITNYQYENILKPLYTWLTSLRVLNMINFSVFIFNVGKKLAVALVFTRELKDKPVLIPANLKNIVFRQSLARQMVQIKDYKSIILDDITYSSILQSATGTSIVTILPNKELYIQLEKMAYTKLIKLLPSINSLKPLECSTEDGKGIIADYYYGIQAELVYKLVVNHHTLLNRRISTAKTEQVLKQYEEIRQMTFDNSEVHSEGEGMAFLKTLKYSINNLINLIKNLINNVPAENYKILN